MDTASDWKNLPVVMMDFEGGTTSGVIEYGVVILARGEISGVKTAFCRPVGRIAERDYEVHGIREEHIRHEPPFAQAYTEFVGWRRSGIFAAHNRHAENSFLKQTWALPPLVPDRRSGSGQSQEWGPWIDTLSIYRSLYPGLPAYALRELVELFGCRGELEILSERFCPTGRRKFHCALYDALASSLLLLRLDEEGTLQGRVSTGWLVELSVGHSIQEELF